MASKVEQLLEATGGEIGVLEGWGGMYLLELVPVGIAGAMPGLALADLLVRVYNHLCSGNTEGAWHIFQSLLPQIVYSLQSLELFHHAEKLLLKERGVLSTAIVREGKIQLRPQERAHLDFLNSRILSLLQELGLPRNPARPQLCPEPVAVSEREPTTGTLSI